MTGICNDVLGTFSATINKNTVKAKRTEIPGQQIHQGTI